MSKPNLIIQVGGTAFSRSFHSMIESMGVVRRTTKPTAKVGYVKGAFSRAVLRNRSRKQLSYRPGTLGLSSVSEAIEKQHGDILSRRQRRQIARESNLRRPKSQSRSR